MFDVSEVWLRRLTLDNNGRGHHYRTKREKTETTLVIKPIFLKEVPLVPLFLDLCLDDLLKKNKQNLSKQKGKEKEQHRKNRWFWFPGLFPFHFSGADKPFSLSKLRYGLCKYNFAWFYNYNSVWFFQSLIQSSKTLSSRLATNYKMKPNFWPGFSAWFWWVVWKKGISVNTLLYKVPSWFPRKVHKQKVSTIKTKGSLVQFQILQT